MRPAPHPAPRPHTSPRPFPYTSPRLFAHTSPRPFPYTSLRLFAHTSPRLFPHTSRAPSLDPATLVRSGSNFSDDELTFLPFYAMLAACSPPSPCASLFDPHSHAAILAALDRTWGAVRPGRSSLWSAIWLAISGRTDADATGALRWNLQTWPLEMVEWPVDNSHRQDIFYEPTDDRFGHGHTQSTHTRSPLPANERRQVRWNANPWDVSAGGDGRTEMDPGAWLLPYWLARYHGLLGAHA